MGVLFSFIVPVGTIFFKGVYNLPNFITEKIEPTEVQEGYFTKKDFIEKSRKKFFDEFKDLGDEEIFYIMIVKYPVYKHQIVNEQTVLNYYKAIPFTILLILLTLIIYLGFLLLIRGITYYIILGSFNPKN